MFGGCILAVKNEGTLTWSGVTAGWPDAADGHRLRAQHAPIGVAVTGHDSRLVERIETALAREGLAARITYAGTGGAGVVRLSSTPDVVVVDACRGTRYRSESLTIRRQLPRAQVIAIVADDLSEPLRRALYPVVHGVVLESAIEPTLGLAVRCARLGQLTVPLEHGPGRDAPALSRRERQVLRLVQSGLTNSEIAARLFLSQSTVKGHLTSAFRQLGVRSRDEAVALILNAGGGLRRSVLTAPLSHTEHETAGKASWN